MESTYTLVPKHLKVIMRFILFLIAICLICCNKKPSKESCHFSFFEKTSQLEFPRGVQIINCGDNLEGGIWVHLQFPKKDMYKFISKINFHSYSSNTEYITDDTGKIIPFFSDDVSIETFEQNMSEKYVEIPKTELTFITTIQKEKEYLLTYILNIRSGMFWGHIVYPDRSIGL